MDAKTVGDVVELIGTLITAAGLAYAWHKASGRLRGIVQAFNDWKANLRTISSGRRDVTVQATAAQAFAFSEGAVVVTRSPAVDADRPVAVQLRNLGEQVQAVRDDIRSTNERIDELRNAPKLSRQDVDNAVADALSDFKLELDVLATKDLTVALIGIGTTATGIIVGMFG
ncbi:hypothetical protein K8O92_12765 [Nocardia asteroides]|nr:hypothetical protein K8O92_12765 [Nocardia asteroides]